MSMNEMMEQRRKRAKEIETHGTIRKAVKRAAWNNFRTSASLKADYVKLINQGVKTFVEYFRSWND